MARIRDGVTAAEVAEDVREMKTGGRPVRLDVIRVR
jgi:hypothetical protein